MLYSEKLKDPRWQKKRLNIFKRDYFTCQLCGSTERTLHVHHKEYSGEPWEANNDNLITYCNICHHVIEFFISTKMSQPYKVIVFSEPVTIIAFRRGDEEDHCFVFEYVNEEILFETGLRSSWVKEIFKTFSKKKNRFFPGSTHSKDK